jgi:hypothetical protein
MMYLNMGGWLEAMYHPCAYIMRLLAFHRKRGMHGKNANLQLIPLVPVEQERVAVRVCHEPWWQ